MMYVNEIRTLFCEDLFKGSRDLPRPRLLPVIKVEIASSQRMNPHPVLFRPHRVTYTALATSQGARNDDDLTASADQGCRVCRDDQLCPPQELRREAMHH